MGGDVGAATIRVHRFGGGVSCVRHLTVCLSTSLCFVNGYISACFFVSSRGGSVFCAGFAARGRREK